jgi:HEAT repeat protein
MNRARRAIIALVLVLAGTGVVVLWPRQPSYGGKTLASWLRNLQGTTPAIRGEAQEAIRQIGTNALPILVRKLRAEDSPMRIRLFRWLRRTSILGIPMREAEDWRLRAADACGALGPMAEPAIPDLLEASKKSVNSYNVTMRALSDVGAPAVNPLISALTNANSTVRQAAAGALGYMGPQAQAAVPALVKSMRDEDARVRVNAALALGKIGVGSAEAVNALTSALTDPDYAIRCNAIFSLGHLGKAAEAAVPALTKLLNDPDPFLDSSVRGGATNALRSITGKVP